MQLIEFVFVDKFFVLFGDDVEFIWIGEFNVFFDVVILIMLEFLCWWFQEDYCQNCFVNFYEGQCDVILVIIYVYEVLQFILFFDFYE